VLSEPLDNYDELLCAVRALVDPGRFNLSAGRVTISTVGMVPRMRALARVRAEPSPCGLCRDIVAVCY
jgi:adenine C2-methylase RlmN of 23S rRNA A2503 and tRNA A37